MQPCPLPLLLDITPVSPRLAPALPPLPLCWFPPFFLSLLCRVLLLKFSLEEDLDEDMVDERRILLMVTFMKSTTSSNSSGSGFSMMSETHYEKWQSYKDIKYWTTHIILVYHITLAIEELWCCQKVCMQMHKGNMIYICWGIQFELIHQSYIWILFLFVHQTVVCLTLKIKQPVCAMVAHGLLLGQFMDWRIINQLY